MAVADVGEAFGRVVGGCKRLTGAADRAHRAAGHLRSEHQAEYGRINTAMTSSKARQAKPGFTCRADRAALPHRCGAAPGRRVR
ncbi:hypothetical protein ACFV0T_42040, partial [Streptomyces sp. NPDC059582]